MIISLPWRIVWVSIFHSHLSESITGESTYFLRLTRGIYSIRLDGGYRIISGFHKNPMEPPFHVTMQR